jgi:hypothetical protein
LDDGTWLYFTGSGSQETAGYAIRFKEGKVRYVLYAAMTDQTGNPWMHGFTIQTPYETVLEKLGQPSYTSKSSDGLQRMMSFEKYNVFYTFEQAKVRDFGIYDPATGPMEYSKPASAPVAERKKASGN